MEGVFVVSDNILSPLGATTTENFARLGKAVSGIKLHDDAAMSAAPFYASLFDPGADIAAFGDPSGADLAPYTKFEQLLIASIGEALQNSGIDPGNNNTVLILSSTKGNISLLETVEFDPALKERIALYSSAKWVAGYFGFANPAIVTSNACISGIVALLTGMRLIQSGWYENAVIAGADIISKFVLSGFQAFQAISPEPCKPFDESRSGISLGEGAATLILSAHPGNGKGIRISGGAVSNDANHLSAPSRTGEELCFAIEKTLKDAGLSAADIDFISAHGTATQYNDEMEAKAITLAGLAAVPLNSLKGYYGHTLGAAGLIESIISIRSLEENLVLPTLGFGRMGVSQPLNICTELLSAPLKNCLKTASGFGGCNAAIAFSKE
jgi:3-oxoacyl-[acyl-carrier-protein] synthase-1